MHPTYSGKVFPLQTLPKESNHFFCFVIKYFLFHVGKIFLVPRIIFVDSMRFITKYGVMLYLPSQLCAP